MSYQTNRDTTGSSIATVRRRRSVFQNRTFLDRTPTNSGFSLIELLVVVAMLLLLTTIAVMKLSPAEGMAKEKIARKDMNRIYRAVMGDANHKTGFYHETRTTSLTGLNQFQIPPYVSFLISSETLGYSEALGDYLNMGTNLNSITEWDPNHRRGYRPEGYLIGNGQEVVEKDTTVVGTYSTLTDPWGRPYTIEHYDDIEEARIISEGPNDTTHSDDLVLYFINRTE